MKFKQFFSGPLIGAAFLMATSAIGPGFITQTTVFTQKLVGSFGFVILISIVLDIIVQLNIWRMIAATGLRAPELANNIVPGLGHLLVVLVAAGGLVFNIGNIAGCGLGLQTLFGTDLTIAAIISGMVAILLFVIKEFGKAMDLFAKVLGFVMIALTLYVAIESKPPVLETMKLSILPEKIDIMAIITIVGGTVGGYISFAGAHRMLDAGVSGTKDMKQVNNGAVSGILLASVMRVLLFLAAIGVVSSGVILNANNPAATVFQSAAGMVGYRIFGVILWSAAITSVVGAAYTSVTFLSSLHPFILKWRQRFIAGFIIISTIVFVIVGNPVNILVKAGAINGLILPLSLVVILIAANKEKLTHQYYHPIWLRVSGWAVAIILGWMGISVIGDIMK